MSLMETYNIKLRKKIGIALLIDIFYAVFDEIHQMFIPGRTGMIQDIGIDTLGAFFGILIVISIIKIYKTTKLCKLNKKSIEIDTNL